jgi:diguanylate cyclase (GGDEF)-like protein
MEQHSLGRYEPRAMAYAAATQFAFGALQCLVGLTLWPDLDPTLRPALIGALVCTIVGSVAHGMLAERLPWWSPYLGAYLGSGTLLYMTHAMWDQRVAALLVAQLVLIVLTVAVFFEPHPVAAHVLFNVVGWAVVCGLHERSGIAVASWLAVGPSMVVAAVLARWLVGRVISLVERDALTGTANRASWNRIAGEPGRGPACVAVIDLDHFKLVNDEHGHAAGDELLRKVAHAWRSSLRPDDVLARLGGDEFAVVLPGLSLDQATAVVERLRTLVQPLTSATIGLAARVDPESLEAALARADRALYEAKRAGRGRVAVANPDPLTPAA